VPATPANASSNLARSAPSVDLLEREHAAATVAHSIETLEAKGASPAAIGLLSHAESELRSGEIPPNALFLPNANALLHLGASPREQVSPTYAATPAPMGVGDFGLGTSNYTLNTSSVLGTANLGSYNATAGDAYFVTSQYEWNGNPATDPGSPYTSGIQLNTILANVTQPGSNESAVGSDVYWTQNVVEFYGNTLTFVDNVWNFSSPGAEMTPTTLVSGNGTLTPAPYYFTGATIPITYPLSVALYNNASIVNGNDVLKFGYRISDAQAVYSGVYDTLVFNSNTSGLPLLAPGFRVDGNETTPMGLLFDSELIFGGPGDGTNAVITNLTGNLSLAYLNGHGTWYNAPSAYDYGADTGETATGMAETWSGGTVETTQGPSILYGLWNTTNGAPSGRIAFTGASDPNYALTFIGEASNGATSFPSYAPSNASGVVATYLPPSLPSPYTAYGLLAYADEFAPFSTTFTGAQSNFSIALPSAPGTLDAPLYMDGNAQAAALAQAIDHSTSIPYRFTNLTIAMDPTLGETFNRLNDFGFTSFNLVLEEGLTTPVVLSNVSQGPNNGSQTDYSTQFGGTVSLPYESQEYVDYGGVGDVFANLSLPCDYNYSFYVNCVNAVSLWGTQGAVADDLDAQNGAAGVWASAAADTTVENSVAGTGANAFNVVASVGSVGWNLTTTGYATAVEDIGGADGTFSFLNLSVAYGFYSIEANGTRLFAVDAFESPGAVFVNLGNDTLVDGLVALDGALGAVGSTTNAFTAIDVNASAGSIGVETAGTSNLSLSEVNASGGSTGVDDAETLGTTGPASTIAGVTATGNSTGVELQFVSDVALTDIEALGDSTGVSTLYSSNLTFSEVNAEGNSTGITLQQVNGVTISQLSASANSTGLAGGSGSASPITNLTLAHASATEGSIAIGAPLVGNASFSDVQATLHSAGVLLENASGVQISSVTASGGSIGVGLIGSGDARVTDVTDSNLAPWSPWTSTFTWDPDGSGSTYSRVQLPDAAIDTQQCDNISIANVHGVDTVGLADERSGYGTATTLSGAPIAGGLTVSDLNVTVAPYAVLLNGTEDSTLRDLGAFEDGLGVAMNGTSGNWVTASTFVSDVGYGVATVDASGDHVWDNSFIDDNGAGSTFSAAHVQASVSAGLEYFNESTTGNYWADWHNYSGGVLAPYFVGSGSYDDHPLGAPANTFAITFEETGLPTGGYWSVTLDGVQNASTGPTIGFEEENGTYSYTVSPVAGYVVNQTHGTVTVSGAVRVVAIGFSVPIPAQYAVTFTETGLPSGTLWNVTFEGKAHSATTAGIVFSSENGSNLAWSVAPVPGFTVAPAAGTLNVTGSPVGQTIAFTAIPAQSYVVTFTESALPAGASWTVTLGGNPHSSSTASIAFTLVNGTYAYSVGGITGYVSSAPGRSVTVNGANIALTITFTASGSSSPGGTGSNGGFTPVDWALVGIAIAFVAVGLGGLLLSRGRGGSKPKPPSPEPNDPHAGAPPSN
jgi:Thermopsin/Periplasmic copper-binding protein (NosD)